MVEKERIPWISPFLDRLGEEGGSLSPGSSTDQRERESEGKNTQTQDDVSFQISCMEEGDLAALCCSCCLVIGALAT
jgi:hypothetical protein